MKFGEMMSAWVKSSSQLSAAAEENLAGGAAAPSGWGCKVT